MSSTELSAKSHKRQHNSRSGFQGLRNLSQLGFLDIEGKERN